MQSSFIEPGDIASTVIAVPPVALTGELRVAHEANAALVRHMQAGGVRVVLYGGNANLYHYDLGLYAEAIETMRRTEESGLRVICSIGPDFGKAMDQVPLVKRAGFRNVMLLPMAFPVDSGGIADGVRRIADALGHGVIFYIRRDGYVDPDTLAGLVDEGTIRLVKYAVERPRPEEDAYLDALVERIALQSIASGMGETPVVDHIGARRLNTFTSGAVCIAPRASLNLLALLKEGRIEAARAAAEPFLHFERVRSRFGGIQVLHDCISEHVADMGPLLPMLSHVVPEGRAAMREALAGLVEAERLGSGTVGAAG